MDEHIIIMGPSGEGKTTLSNMLQDVMSKGKHREMCKLSPQEEQEKIRSMFLDREMKLEQEMERLKSKDVLDNIGLIKAQDLLKEVAKRGLNLEFTFDSLESVSTTKLKEELRRRKK